MQKQLDFITTLIYIILNIVLFTKHVALYIGLIALPIALYHMIQRQQPLTLVIYIAKYNMITVDTREHLIPQIQDLLVTKILGPEVPEFQFHCLPLADYLLENSDHNILIERKSISDFCGSFRTLKARLAKMRKLDYERIGLLLEGTYTVANGQIWLYEGNIIKPRMSYRSFSNFVTHQEELGVRLYHTMNLEETIWRLIHIHNYLPNLDAPTPVIKAGSATEWLSELPGIGPKSLNILKEKYKTPMGVIMNLPEKTKKLLDSW